MKAILRRISPLQVRVTFFNSEDVDKLIPVNNEPNFCEVDTGDYEFYAQRRFITPQEDGSWHDRLGTNDLGQAKIQNAFDDVAPEGRQVEVRVVRKFYAVVPS